METRRRKGMDGCSPENRASLLTGWGSPPPHSSKHRTLRLCSQSFGPPSPHCFIYLFLSPDSSFLSGDCWGALGGHFNTACRQRRRHLGNVLSWKLQHHPWLWVLLGGLHQAVRHKCCRTAKWRQRRSSKKQDIALCMHHVYRAVCRKKSLVLFSQEQAFK